MVGVMHGHRFSVDKAQDLLFRLNDIETLLTLAEILPLLHEMNVLVKMAQSRTMYIAEYTNATKLACLALDNLYIMAESVTGLEFRNWSKIINIENDDFFLSLMKNGCYVWQFVGIWFPFIIMII